MSLSFWDGADRLVHLRMAKIVVIFGHRHLTTPVRSFEILESLGAHVVDLGVESFKDVVDTLEDWVIFDASSSESGMFVVFCQSIIKLRPKSFTILTRDEGLSTHYT